jgi:hypothetical protein
MIELFYYIDSAGLNEGNRELADMGCEECLKKKCSDGESRNLWRLPSREHLDDFLRRAKREQWFVRIFWGKTREEKPKQIFAEDLDMNEERLKTHHGGRRPIKPLHEEAASLIPAR